jgi:hypothetical protein
VTYYDKESSLSDTSVESSDTTAIAAADERNDHDRAHRNQSSGSRHHRYAPS